jgi:hypothetical protein
MGLASWLVSSGNWLPDAQVRLLHPMMRASGLPYAQVWLIIWLAIHADRQGSLFPRFPFFFVIVVLRSARAASVTLGPIYNSTTDLCIHERVHHCPRGQKPRVQGKAMISHQSRSRGVGFGRVGFRRGWSSFWCHFGVCRNRSIWRLRCS